MASRPDPDVVHSFTSTHTLKKALSALAADSGLNVSTHNMQRAPGYGPKFSQRQPLSIPLPPCPALSSSPSSPLSLCRKGGLCAGVCWRAVEGRPSMSTVRALHPCSFVHVNRKKYMTGLFF